MDTLAGLRHQMVVPKYENFSVVGLIEQSGLSWRSLRHLNDQIAVLIEEAPRDLLMNVLSDWPSIEVLLK